MSKFEDGSYQCLPGPALIAKVLAGRCTMNYTRAAVGQGSIPEGVSPKSLTEPPDYVMDAKIAAVTTPVDGECQVTVQINSDDVETGFYAMGILLYAEDPDLGEVPYTYLKLEEGMEWIRPASSAVGKLATFDLIAAVGAVDVVSANIDPDAIMTRAAVEQLVAEATALSTVEIFIPKDGWRPTEDQQEAIESGLMLYQDIAINGVRSDQFPAVSMEKPSAQTLLHTNSSKNKPARPTVSVAGASPAARQRAGAHGYIPRHRGIQSPPLLYRHLENRIARHSQFSQAEKDPNSVIFLKLPVDFPPFGEYNKGTVKQDTPTAPHWDNQ